jgi:hypothetical protein
MEFVEGKSLGKRIEEEGTGLQEDLAVDIIRQIATALQQIHQLNLVHRDVKPDNILLGPGGAAKLTDLGLVKVLDDDIDLTRPNSGLGTPYFMAPEQFSNAKAADPRFDIYSLGATLYMTVTGHVPFQSENTWNVFTKKLRGELIPALALAPRLSPRIDQTIARAMQVDPLLRHGSCQEFIAELTGKGTSKAARANSGRVRSLRQPAKQYAGPEKRAHIRLASDQQARCLPVAGHVEDEWVGSVHDISVTGLGLIVNRSFEAGTVLQVRLQGQGEDIPAQLFVRVVHNCSLRPRKWLLGCAFPHPLGEEELKALAGTVWPGHQGARTT